jgi:hypothetical protein
VNLNVSDDLDRKMSKFVELNAAGPAKAKAGLKVERDDDRLRPHGLTTKLSDYPKKDYAKQLRAAGKRDSASSIP